jgi:hypothetical protein
MKSQRLVRIRSLGSPPCIKATREAINYGGGGGGALRCVRHDGGGNRRKETKKQPICYVTGGRSVIFVKNWKPQQLKAKGEIKKSKGHGAVIFWPKAAFASDFG